MEIHSFNPNTQETDASGTLQVLGHQVYIVNSESD